MGYMGFGMQSWLYKKSPRKPFAKRETLSSFSPLQNYSRVFKLKPSIKCNKKINEILTVAIIFIFAIFIFFLSSKFVAYSENQSVLVNSRNELMDKEAFAFLLYSGKNRLESNNILDAYTEFKFAYDINSNDKELNQLLIETLSILCEKEEKYCKELDLFMETNY